MSDVNQFIIFCLESYKSASGLTGEQAFADFEAYDVFSYLSDGFDVLHTQGREYIIKDIQEYIACRK
ncbi:MAG: DUF3791 domain-containing protein [Dysgonamonadaceae bacterium]|jgi:hypothetical protein|nr:DUF3791 domain-containing protein [Dysgonamonadaceae bacterium]